MTSTKIRMIACSASFLFSAVGAVQAQTPDQMKMFYEASRNQLGVLEYCSDKGMGDTAAIETQKKLMAMLPPPADISGGDAAQRQGRSGKVVALGVEKSLDEAAKEQGSAPNAFCQKIADAVKSAGAQLR